MEQKLSKTAFLFGVILIISLLNVLTFGQSQPTKLTLNTFIESEIKGGETQKFIVSLSANQTARVEIVQNGTDVSLAAVNPQGETFIMSESPSGYFGDDLILVTAKEAGEYKIEVTPANPRARAGKYSILLKEIRNSVPEDFRINDAAGKITKLAEAATVAKYKGTIEGKREALQKWDEAIELSKIKKDRVWEGVALVAKGLIYDQLGEIQNALDAHLASLEIWLETKNKQYEGSAVNNIGLIYADLGEHEKAIPYYEQAIKIQQEIGDRNSIGVYFNNLAYSYMQLENYEKAENYFRESLTLKKQDDSVRGKRSLSNTLNNLGIVLDLKGETEKGIDFLQEGLSLRRELNYRWGIANSLLNLGKVYLNAGVKETGFKNLTEANLYAGELGDRRMAAESFYLLAVAERERGNLEKAIENASRGLDLIEEIRSELIGTESRYAYFSTVQNFYDLYIDLLVSRFEKTKNKVDAALALEMSERSRSRSLLELLQEANVNFRREVDAELFGELKNLQKEITDKYAARQNLLGGKPKPEEIEKINNEINVLNTQIHNLKIRVRRENPKYADLAEGKTISAAEIQELLNDETVLLEYKLGERRSFVWLVTKSTLEVFELPPRKQVEELTRNFYDLIVANKKDEEAKMLGLSKDLGKLLLLPLDKKVSGKRLVIVADGILQYTPFSALYRPQAAAKVLADENEIVVLPSASVLSQLRKSPHKNKEKNKTIAVFADPVFDGEDSRITMNPVSEINKQNVVLKQILRDFKFGETLPRLLASREEARNISSFVNTANSSVKTDFQANLKNVENAELSDYRILHFATHGLLNTSQPELSGLVFSLYDKRGQPQEGFLSLNDIYNLNLSSDMVVLSACQTALGKDVRGEGLIGISRGFLYAGSDRIIASLWKVDDSATAEFMKLFYKNHLEKEMPASAALRQAKIEMKKIPRYKSPFYWSAFTLLGEWK